MKKLATNFISFQIGQKFNEWSSFPETSLGKRHGFLRLAWNFFMHAQYYFHILSLLNFEVGTAREAAFGRSSKIVILSLTMISLFFDLFTKSILWFEFMVFKRRIKLVFIYSILSLLLDQILFLTVLEANMTFEELPLERKYQKTLTLLINYLINGVYFSMGLIRWDLFIFQNLTIFLIFLIIMLIKIEFAQTQLIKNSFEYTVGWGINALLFVSAISLFEALGKNAKASKIFKKAFHSSPVGKLIIRNKELVFANEAILSVFFRRPAICFENLSELAFSRYLNEKTSRVATIRKSGTNSRKPSSQYIKKKLSLSEVLEILKRNPTDCISLYTMIKIVQESKHPKTQKTHQENLDDFKIIFTEENLTTEGDFSDLFLKQIQVKVRYLDWESLGSEYIFMEFTDYSEAQSIIEAEQIIEYKTGILHSFSHELKTPLNISKNLISALLSEESVTIALKEKILNPIQTSLNMLDYLIHDIIDFLKIETNQLDLELSDFDLKQLIQEVLALLEYSSREKLIDINLTIQGSEACPVYTDRIRLMRALINIISFIIKTNQKITLNLSIGKAREGGYSLSIYKRPREKEETKIIMEKSLLINNEIKSPITKDLDLTTKNDFGLIISKMMLEHLIDEGIENFLLANLEGQRGLIQIIPLHLTSQKIVKATSREPIKFPKSLVKPFSYPIAKHLVEVNSCPQILVVDDDPFNILSISMILDKFKISVLKANNGLEAIEVYKNFQKTHKCKKPSCLGIEVILMDLMMPVMNRMESCETLMKMMGDREVPNVTIVACSANDSRDVRDACMLSGFAGFISKPINSQKLKKELKKYITFVE